MIDDKIEKTLEYYLFKRKEIIDFVNNKTNLTPDDIILNGEFAMVIVANILQKPGLYSLYMTKLQVYEKRAHAMRLLFYYDGL